MKIRKAIALTLAAVMTCSLAACGGSASSSATSAPASTVSAPAQSAGEIDIWAPYDETVHLTTALVENAGIQWHDGDTYDDNPWYREYKDRFNIEVTNDWVVSSDYTTKLNLAIADGSLPDVFFCKADQFQQLYEAGLIWDLTDVYEQYASDTLKSYMEQEADTFETAKRDGKVYAIPQLSYGVIDQINQIWIRHDWMESSGLSAPKSIEDVEAVARAFMKEHGGYGITEDKDLTSFKLLSPAWGAYLVAGGAYSGIWMETADGSLGYSSVQPEVKDALAAYSQWYKDGIINPEFTSQDMTQMSQEVVSGTVGINPFYQWWGDDPGVAVIGNLGTEAIFDAHEIPSATGKEVKFPITFPNYGYIVVSKNCENPEAAIKLLNLFAYLSDDAAGKEDPEWLNNFFDKAYPVIPYGLRVFNPNTDYDQYVQVSGALEQGEGVDVTALGKNSAKYYNCVDYIKNGTPASVADYCQQGNGEYAAYYTSKNVLDSGRIIKDAMWGAPTATLSTMGTTLDDILIEGFTQIIVGQKPVEYFDTVVESWKAAGGDQATQEINEMYGK